MWSDYGGLLSGRRIHSRRENAFHVGCCLDGRVMTRPDQTKPNQTKPNLYIVKTKSKKTMKKTTRKRNLLPPLGDTGWISGTLR